MALRLGIALQPFWNTRGYHSEGRSFLERALVGSDDVEDALRAGVLHTTHDGQMQWQGMMALRRVLLRTILEMRGLSAEEIDELMGDL